MKPFMFGFVSGIAAVFASFIGLMFWEEKHDVGTNPHMLDPYH